MNRENNLVRHVGYAFWIGLLVLSLPAVSFSQRNRSPQGNSRSSQPTDVIPEDTVISVRINDYLSSKSSRVGDKFTATVDEPVLVAGQVAIPAGATIEGHVTRVIPAKRMNKSGSISVEFDTITLPNGLSTQIVGVLTSNDPEVRRRIDDENRVSGEKGKDAGVFIGSSGAIGAVLGAITGGAKGAMVGGAVGAGIGLAGVLMTKGEDAAVPVGTVFGIRLKQALPSPTNAANVGPIDNGNQPPADSSNPPDSGSPATESRPRLTRQPAENNGAPTTSDPPPSQPENREGEINSTTTANPDASATEEKPLPLTSSEMIRRAQIALNEEGYYEGEINGQMNPRTSAAIKAYQHEKNLPETGTLDEATARSLKILGKPKPASVPATQPDRTSSTPVGSSQRRATNSTDDEISISANRVPVRQTANTGGEQPQIASRSAAIIVRQAQDLLAEYQRMIGVRLTGTGIESNGRYVYSDDDIDLLFALDSFANRAQLYIRLLPTLQTQQSIRSATLALAKEARRTDRIITTSSSRWINGLNPRWDATRQEVLKLMYAYGINTSEIEN